MKKILFVVGTVLAISTASFAQPVAEIKASVSGSAQLSWGYDVLKTTYGFKNDASATATIAIYGETFAEKGGEGDYGYIKIKAVETKLKNGAIVGLTASIDTAKLFIGPLAINILTGQTAIDYEVAIPEAYTLGDANNSAVYGQSGKGFTVSLREDGAFNFDFSVTTKEDRWSNEFAANNYNFFLGATVKPMDGLEVKVAGAYDLNDKELGAGLSVAFKTSLGEAMALKIGVGFDFDSMDSVAQYGIGGYVWLIMAANEDNIKPVQNIYLSATRDWAQTDRELAPGFKVNYNIDLDTTNIDLSTSFAQTFGPLGAAVFADIEDLSGTMDLGLGLELQAKIDAITVQGGGKYKMPNGGTASAQAYVGFFAGILPNTTLGLVWSSGDLVATTADIGVIDILVKIAY